MNAKEIKEYIKEHNKVELILNDLGCHSIKRHANYWSAGNPDGDNKGAVCVYGDLGVINYTRELPIPSDIFTLIEYYKKINFFHALKYVCDLLELDIYSDPDTNLYESLRITKIIREKKAGIHQEEDTTPIKVLPESFLNYYTPCVNDFWLKDNVPFEIQKEWELAYDNVTNRIVIPIRDEIGNLVGLKGRLFKELLNEDDLKYIYIEPTPRNKILYGLYKTYPHIKNAGKVFVFEAEKSVHQMWAAGYKNSIATGGERISKTQIDNMSRLAVDIIWCMDKDVSKEKIEDIGKLFVDGINVYYLWDDKGLLRDKESPSDRKHVFEELLRNHCYKLK